MRMRTLGTRKPMFLLLLPLVFLAAGPPDAPVADAAMRGDLDSVREMLRRGADVNAPQADGMTALHWAAERGDVELTEMLLFADAHPGARTRNGHYTPLHLAARAGQSGTVGLLVEDGAVLDAGSRHGATALHFAAGSGIVSTVEALLTGGAQVDPREGAYDQTPLMWAAAEDHVAVVERLLAAGADPTLFSRVEDIAARAEADERRLRLRNLRVDAVTALREAEEAGEEVSLEDVGVERTIEAFQENSDDEEDETEEEEGSEPEPLSYDELVGKKGGLTPLHFAAREGSTETALRLLAEGVDVNRVTEGDGSSPMLLAVINGHFDLAREILDRGGDPNRTSVAGASPLYVAIDLQWHPKSIYPSPQHHEQQEHDYLDLMQALLDAGADPDVRLEKTLWYTEYNFERLSVEFAGATPFWRAAYGQDVEAMKLLVEHGADPTIPTKRMPERRFRGYDEEDVEDPSGLPPVPLYGPAAYPIHAATGIGFGEGYAGGFHKGAPNGWLPTVRYLVEEHGADVNARDVNGYAPLHHAASRGDVATIRFLVEHGADVTLVSRRGQTTADMANSPVQRVPVHEEALALLESLGADNNYNCQVC